MSAPAISICIPAFNAARFISETLVSVHEQTFDDWELIVVEDGSRDGTEEIVRAFAELVSQPVLFFRHEVNRGLPATRNTAMSHARGEWVAFLDSDDLWLPQHLALVHGRAIASRANLVHTGVVLFDSDSGRDLEVRAPAKHAGIPFEQALFTGDYPIQPSSALVQRELCERTGGFDPACRYVEDREFWVRLARAGASIEFVDTVTCRYRQHAGAMTRRVDEIAAGLAGVLERNADWEAVPRAVRRGQTASAWVSAGRIVLRVDPRRARGYFARALRQRPASPRILAYWGAAALLGLGRREEKVS